MKRRLLTDALNEIKEDYILEAINFYAEKENPMQDKKLSVNKRLWIIAAVVVCFVALSAFAVSIFSPLNGDALTLQGSQGRESFQKKNYISTSGQIGKMDNRRRNNTEEGGSAF